MFPFCGRITIPNYDYFIIGVVHNEALIQISNAVKFWTWTDNIVTGIWNSWQYVHAISQKLWLSKPRSNGILNYLLQTFHQIFIDNFPIFHYALCLFPIQPLLLLPQSRAFLLTVATNRGENALPNKSFFPVY
jgi:hypothetical protein